MKKLSLSLLCLSLLGSFVSENSLDARFVRKNSHKKNKKNLRKKLSLKSKKFFKKNKNPRRIMRNNRNKNISFEQKSVFSSGKILEATQEIRKLLNEISKENYYETNLKIEKLFKENEHLLKDLSTPAHKAIIYCKASLYESLIKLPEIFERNSDDELRLIKINLTSTLDKLILDMGNYQKEEQRIQEQENTKKKLEQKNKKNNDKKDSKKDKKESEGFFTKIKKFFTNPFGLFSKKDEKKAEKNNKENKSPKKKLHKNRRRNRI